MGIQSPDLFLPSPMADTNKTPDFVSEAQLRQRLLDLQTRRRVERMLQEEALERPGGLP